MSKVMKWKKWIVGGILVLLVGGGVWWAVAGREPEAPEIFTVEAEPFAQVITATGRLVPGNRVEIQSLVSGQIMSLPYDEGDLVNQGDVVASFDDGDVRQRIVENQAQVNLAQARTRLISELAVPSTQEELTRLTLERDQLARSLERQEALYQQGALPLETLEEAQNQAALMDSRIRGIEIALASQRGGGAEAAEASAAVAAARSSLSGLERELNKYALQAPFTGKVLERFAEPGEWVQPGQVLLVMATEEGYYAEVELDERSMGLIQLGQPARIWPEAYPSQEVSATVDAIAPRVDATTGTVRVRLALSEEADYFIQDLTIQAEIEVRTMESALLLPVSALWQENPNRVLLALDGQVQDRVLSKVEFISLNQMLVLEGLDDGDVIVMPQSGLQPGDAVTLPGASEGGGGQ